MNYMSIKEASALWGVSQQMIRRYCREGRITGAIQKDGSWAVPINANKPGQPAVIAPPKELKDFAKHVVYQHEKNYHFGIYEYIQVNLAYSSNRMASNRLTRVQVMEAYRTNRVSVAFEPMKIDDVIETVNHFLCIYQYMENLSDGTPTGICVTPHIFGSMNPEWSEKNTAKISGLTANTSKATLYQAVLEGTCCELDLNLRVLEKLNKPINRLLMTGGGTNSDRWMQMRADITTKPIEVVCNGVEASCLGAAILAGIGAKLFADVSDANGRIKRNLKKYQPKNIDSYGRTTG